MQIHAIILAGGTSSRFKCPISKVLYPLFDKPIIEHLIDTLSAINISQITIVSGTRSHAQLQKYSSDNIKILEQKEPLGTFDAVLTALDSVSTDSMLILNADTPLVSKDLLLKMVNSCSSTNVIATIHTDNPFGLGRIIRDSENNLIQIIEEKELTDEQRRINIINAGIYKLNVADFKKVIKEKFDTTEQYLTSYLGTYIRNALPCQCIDEHRSQAWTLQGINTLEDFEVLEQAYFAHKRKEILEAGGILKNARDIKIYGEQVKCEPGATLIGPCILKGKVLLKQNTTVEPFTIIDNTSLDQNSTVKSFSMLNETHLGSNNIVGPYLRTRSSVVTADGVQLGNFLEVKNSQIGAFSKIKHFGYIGDGTIGQRCNIGAGCIFCNYDGKNKHRTFIKDNVFIGASSQFVAPITVEENCLIGASTLVTENLPKSTLAIRRTTLKKLIKEKQ